MIAKMKSVCALGRNIHFARPAPSPTPVDPPLPSAISDCDDLVAGVRRVGERVEEREHAGPAVRLGHREERHQR